jgi:hypothetical protein
MDMSHLRQRAIELDSAMHRVLVARSIDALRISIGAIKHISESDYRRWRDEMLDGAILAMTTATE